MRTVPTRLIAALTLALLLLSGTAFGRVATFCKMAGRTVSSCCCHPSAAETTKRNVSKQDAAPAVDRAGCCEQRAAKASRVPASLGELSLSPALAVCVTELLPLRVEPLVQALAAVPRAARGPPRHGPPLYIEHCALLN